MIAEAPRIPTATLWNLILSGRCDLCKGAALGVELLLFVFLLASCQGVVDFAPQLLEGDGIAGGFGGHLGGVRGAARR